jgi:hypothetical protein
MQFAGVDAMTKRRCVVMACIAVVSVAISLPTILALIPSGPGPTKTNFDKIQKGMPRAEVEAILGPDGWCEAAFSSGIGFSWWVWTSKDGARVRVGYLMVPDGEIVRYTVNEMSWTPSNETTFERLKRWLHVSA